MSENKYNEELQHIDKETSNTNLMNIESEDIDLSTEIDSTSNFKDLTSDSMVYKLALFFQLKINKNQIY